MITLALDASTKATGIAVFKNEQLLSYDCFTSSHKNVLTRIKYMVDNIEKWYNEFQPDQIIIEQIIPDNLTNDENQWIKNKNTFTALFYLQAAIVLMFHEHGKQVEFIGASSWRKACKIKQGRGEKRDVLKPRDIEFVKNTYNIQVNDDIADAICIGYAKVHETPQPQPFNWE